LPAALSRQKIENFAKALPPSNIVGFGEPFKIALNYAYQQACSRRQVPS